MLELVAIVLLYLILISLFLVSSNMIFHAHGAVSNILNKNTVKKLFDTVIFEPVGHTLNMSKEVIHSMVRHACTDPYIVKALHTTEFAHICTHGRDHFSHNTTSQVVNETEFERLMIKYHLVKKG